MTFLLSIWLSGVKLGISCQKRRKRQILVGKQLQPATEQIWEFFERIYICIFKNLSKTSCLPWQEPLAFILKTQNVLSSDRSPFWNVCFCIFVSGKHVKYLSFAIVLKCYMDTHLCNIVTTMSYARAPGKCQTSYTQDNTFPSNLLLLTSNFSDQHHFHPLRGSSHQLSNMW